jgi:AAA domain
VVRVTVSLRRLVGDDQQLAAIGAGGVLRDIQSSYGAVRLSELHRFPHTVTEPENVHVRTATELLEQILGREGSPRSASTLQRELQDPNVRLGAAAARYLDALHLAAEHLAGPEVVANLDRSADRVLHGLPASRRGRLCVAICCCCPLPAPIRSLNCSALPQSGT